MWQKSKNNIVLINYIFNDLIKMVYFNRYKISWIALVFSVVISVFIRAPFAFQDEQVHYIRALGISNNQVFSYSQSGKDSELGHDIDSANLLFVDTFLMKPPLISIKWLNDTRMAHTGVKEYRINTSAAPYTPVPYFSYALAAKIARTVGVSVRTEFILMRLAGAITTLLILFIAFKVVQEKYRWFILALSLLPMCIASFAAISIDGFTIASAVLFMSVIYSLVDKIKIDKLHKKDLLLLAFSSFLLITAKMPLFLFIGLIPCMVIIFRNKIPNKYKILFLSLTAISGLLVVCWALFVKDINTGVYWGKNVNTAAQLRYVLLNPLRYLFNLLFSISSYNFFDLTFYTYSNNKFSNNIPFIFDLIIITGLSLSTFVVNRQPKASPQDKKLYWVCVSVFFISVISIFTLLYLQFTPIGTPNEIQGVQPRYFIPFLPLILMIPFKLKLSPVFKIFVYCTPFLGIGIYWVLIFMQLINFRP